MLALQLVLSICLVCKLFRSYFFSCCLDENENLVNVKMLKEH